MSSPNQTQNSVSANSPGETKDALQSLLDRQEIMDLVRLERFWRDQCEWQKLIDAYIEESHVTTTWFSGTGREFAMASKEMYEVRGARGKHMIWPAEVRVNGDRAICESPGTIYSRSTYDGIELDLMSYARFHSLVVRTAAGWKLRSFMGIYQKDVVTPVNPSQTLPIDWEAIKKFRPSYRFLSYSLSRRNYQVPDHLPGDDRPDIVRTYYAWAEHWLDTGEGGFANMLSLR